MCPQKLICPNAFYFRVGFIFVVIGGDRRQESQFSFVSNEILHKTVPLNYLRGDSEARGKTRVEKGRKSYVWLLGLTRLSLTNEAK